MDTTTKYLAAGIAGLALAVFMSLVVAFPASAQTVGGCEMRPVANSNALQRVDPNCTFNFDSSDDSGRPLPADWQDIIDDILNGEDA